MSVKIKTCLFDPITAETLPVEIAYLMELLEKSRSAIDGLKHRRAYIKSLGAFIVPPGITIKEKRELMAQIVPEQEYWKPYPHNPRYLVSNYGRIQGLTRWGTRVFVIGTKSANGRTEEIVCGIRRADGSRATKRIHHLVMETFTPKPIDDQEWVCAHRDFNIWNNRRNNLRWMNRKEFNRWIARFSTVSIPVVKYDLETGEELDEYRSISDASRHNFISAEAIRQSVIGAQRQSGGFGWRCSEDYEGRHAI